MLRQQTGRIISVTQPKSPDKRKVGKCFLFFEEEELCIDTSRVYLSYSMLIPGFSLLITSPASLISAHIYWKNHISPLICLIRPLKTHHMNTHCFTWVFTLLALFCKNAVITLKCNPVVITLKYLIAVLYTQHYSRLLSSCQVRTEHISLWLQPSLI